jgi:hypothetical protein
MRDRVSFLVVPLISMNRASNKKYFSEGNS